MTRTILTTIKDDEKIYRGLTGEEYDEIHLKISFIDSVLEVFKAADIEELHVATLTPLAFEAAYKLEEISKILDREDSKKDN